MNREDEKAALIKQLTDEIEIPFAKFLDEYQDGMISPEVLSLLDESYKMLEDGICKWWSEVGEQTEYWDEAIDMDFDDSDWEEVCDSISKKLKSCALCGGKAEIFGTDDSGEPTLNLGMAEYIVVRCTVCHATIGRETWVESLPHGVAVQVVDLWNKRVNE